MQSAGRPLALPASSRSHQPATAPASGASRLACFPNQPFALRFAQPMRSPLLIPAFDPSWPCPERYLRPALRHSCVQSFRRWPSELSSHINQSKAAVDCSPGKRCNPSLRSRPKRRAPRPHHFARRGPRSPGRHQRGHSRERLPASTAPPANRKRPDWDWRGGWKYIARCLQDRS